MGIIFSRSVPPETRAGLRQMGNSRAIRREREISTPKERQRENDEQNPLPPWWRAW